MQAFAASEVPSFLAAWPVSMLQVRPPSMAVWQSLNLCAKHVWQKYAARKLVRAVHVSAC
jgi:hypothetical protein